MAGQCGPDPLPPGAIALLGGAIRYALGVCAQVTLDELARPTPCADWNLAALLAHLAASMADLESGLRTGSVDPWAPDPFGLARPAGPASPADPVLPAGPASPADPVLPAGPASPADPVLPAGPAEVVRPADPAEVVRDQAANLLFACYAHHGGDRFLQVGGVPLAAGIVAATAAMEIAVHGWDVAVARGAAAEIPPGLAGRLLRLGPLLVVSRPGLFAPPVEVPPGARPGDRLVAYLGRKPVIRPGG